MNSNNQETYIFLVIKAIYKNKKLSNRKIIIFYNIPCIIFQYRIKGLSFHIETQTNHYNIIELKEEVIVQYIFNINLKGFLFKLKNIKDIMNNIFESKGAKYIGKF